MSTSAPHLDLDHWHSQLLQHWGIKATITPLAGEYDLNLLAVTEQQTYVLKVMRAGCDEQLVDMQCQALIHLAAAPPTLPIPKVINTQQQQAYCRISDTDGTPRIAWLLQGLAGVSYADFTPKTSVLQHQLGQHTGHIDQQLQSFQHPYLARDFKWNLLQSLWIEGSVDCLTEVNKKAVISGIIKDFKDAQASLTSLPHQALHNDINDYNIIVDTNLHGEQTISGIIDLGDMCQGPRVCEIAIAGAYIVLDEADPIASLCALVAGYHASNPLTATELKLIWPLLNMRLAVSVINSTLMALEDPDDPYITISQRPAWDFLLREDIAASMVPMRLRHACGYAITDTYHHIEAWLQQHSGSFYPVLGKELQSQPMVPLSVEQSSVPQNPLSITPAEAADLTDYKVDDVSLGYYREPRLVYTEAAFKRDNSPISRRRTVHLGIDIFAPADTPLHAPMASTVIAVEQRPHYLDYGAVVILRHDIDASHHFYSLYGHLNGDSLTNLSIGQQLAAGDIFAELGNPQQNGGWDPHAHVQLATSLAGIDHDWPGAAYPDEMEFWQQLCPNPAPLLNLEPASVCYQPPSQQAVKELRHQHFGRNLKLTYKDPVMFLRGWQHYLFDQWGQPYLDAYNNVPHVGHAHPRIQAVAAKQLQLLNTNSRYLHPSRGQFAKQILSHLPDQLQVCFFVNSGSEANELAIRLARAHTGAKHMITCDHGYHGNTTGAIDLSAYKFNAKGGVGPSDWVHLVDVADTYSGTYRDDDQDNCSQAYAQQVEAVIAKLQQQGTPLAGFIAETFPSVGGQIIPPTSYLSAVYDKIRAAGGVCIADEVQTALGRLGEYYFAFEQQQVVPNIVVLGKPIGNGHPIGVVVTSKEIANSFAEGPEFFSTFGGSNLSCVVGNEVLQIVEDEGLMENARLMGNKLLQGLRDLQQQHQCIGDVRGMGLFIGVQLVTCRDSKAPATELTSYVKNRMREEHILMGSEGPADNILKIRPPLTIGETDVDLLLDKMHQILSETAVIST